MRLSPPRLAVLLVLLALGACADSLVEPDPKADAVGAGSRSNGMTFGSGQREDSVKIAAFDTIVALPLPGVD